MHSAVTTPTFERHAAKAGLSDDEVIDICVWLAAHPQAGALIVGTGGARKVRFAARGKGKSGGYRTIHYYAGDDVPIFLLALIDKRERPISPNRSETSWPEFFRSWRFRTGRA
jgi:hypothetical protein